MIEWTLGYKFDPTTQKGKSLKFFLAQTTPKVTIIFPRKLGNYFSRYRFIIKSGVV